MTPKQAKPKAVKMTAPINAGPYYAIFFAATGQFAQDRDGRLHIYKTEKQANGFVVSPRFEEVVGLTITLAKPGRK